MSDPKKTLWVVTTGEAGNISQALGLANALGIPFQSRTGTVARPWSWLPASIAGRAGLSRLLAPGSDAFEPPWPDVVIACGRRAAMLSLAIRREATRTGSAAPYLVQILNPGVSPANFDLVLAPDHDNLRGPNVLTSLGAMHRLTRATLEEGAAAFREPFSALPRPLVAVLIGGTSGAYRFGIQDARRVALQLEDVARDGTVGLVVTTSRRTGEDQRNLMEKALRHLPNVWFWKGDGPNPYMGMLGLADAVMVTEESVSMISEACFTGKPVYTLGLNGGSVRFTRFHARMEEEGYTRPFRGALKLWAPPKPLDEAQRLAGVIREKLGIGGNTAPG
ncbi:mitochondrial fission ELM1 family protein [Phaeovibrio sulfidiphilus]|uniref:Mitochondrial fission ELM1 family protein n=1 Tax=Phaeovibrio sulfidiphilus TaxID=1220600 RepID=A0A8J6YPL9_9PROT|nr:mitochondrial fission ELM1 family protein [Phaeovibrio sulfidiphilus]MBE1237689.1 mitochondrial fission ELM1 family protein [Phaeovibrio sulfidiphilus]